MLRQGHLVHLVVCLLSLAAAAQAGSLVCSVSGTGGPELRAEGITELLGDLLLTCTGGTPTAAGQTVPPVDLTLTLNAPITSRLLDPSGRSEAVLLIGEPMSSANPNVPLSVCSNTCQVTSNGQNNYNGDATHPNAFVGQGVGTQAITFSQVPIDPASSGSQRILRITNVRASAAAAAATGVSQITATPAFNTSGTSIGPIQIVNPSQPGNTAIVGGSVPSTPSLACGYTGTAVSAKPGSQVSFTSSGNCQETFAGALKSASTSASVNNPTQVLPATTIPAFSNFSETGTAITDPATGILMGSATSGTTLQINYFVPQGFTVTLPGQIPLIVGSNSGGTMFCSAPSGTQSGSNVSVTAGANGTASFSCTVAQLLSSSGTKSFSLNAAISGVAPASPFNVAFQVVFQQTAGFVGAQPFVSGGSPIPIFDQTHIDGSPPLNTDVITTVNNSSSSTASVLSAYGGTVQISSASSMELSAQPVPQNRISETAHASPTASQMALPPSLDVSIVPSGAASSTLSVTTNPTATWLQVAVNETTVPGSVTLTFNPTAPAENYSTNLMITSAGVTTPLQIPVSYNAFAGPWFAKSGFANAASYVNNVVAPGETFIIFGYNFGPSTIQQTTFNPNAQTTLAETQVLFDGQPAPLYYVLDTTPNAIITGFAPFELSGKTTTQVQIVSNGVKSPPVTLNVVNAVPALFTANTTGSGQGAVLNQNFSVNSDSNPASPGDIVSVYGTGGGQTTPAGSDGGVTGVGAPVPTLNLPVKVYLDGVLLTNVPYAGPAPDEVEGIFQVNFQIPANARSGDLPLMIQVGNTFTQAGVTVAVH